MKTKLLVVFPNFLERVHLFKDVGMLPYYFAKQYDIEPTLLARSAAGDGTNRFNRIKMITIARTRLFFLDKLWVYFNFLFFLSFRGVRYSHILIFHLSTVTFFYAFFYKLFNSNGKIFIKLDITLNGISSKFETKGFIAKIRRYFIKRVFELSDVVSCETMDTKIYLEQLSYLNGKVVYLPNGIDNEVLPNNLVKNKKKEIITVGRIGAPEKNHELLLRALVAVDLKEWKFVFVGPVTEDFKIFYQSCIEARSDLNNRIILYGPVEDRTTLYDLFDQSSAFCFSSKYESFGIALMEAAYFNNYLISTDVGAAQDLIDLTRYGIVVNSTVNDFSNAITEFIQSNDRVASIEFDRTKLHWENLIKSKMIDDWILGR